MASTIGEGSGNHIYFVVFVERPISARDKVKVSANFYKIKLGLKLVFLTWDVHKYYDLDKYLPDTYSNIFVLALPFGCFDCVVTAEDRAKSW